MKRCTVLLAMAIVAITTLYSFIPVVQAGPLLPTLTLLQTAPLAQAEAPADVTAKPAVHSTWGAIKALYRAETATDQFPTQPTVQKPGVGMYATYGGDWSNNIYSEACYTLNIYRTGSSNCIFRGMAMSDWVQQVGYTYPRSDPSALDIVSRYIGSGNVGTIDGNYTGCAGRGGYCKFFVDLVLYRSSYGVGNGWHLVLPSGYDYSANMTPYSVNQAQRGWVIQRGGSKPHTAIVATNLGWGLDLIDSNNVDYNGSFVIARHAFSWNDLAGYTAYRPTYMRQWINGRLQ